MIRADGLPLVTQGFASFTLWADDDRWKPRKRDFRLGVRSYPCPVCEAKEGEACVRMSINGPVERRLPHLGRSPPLHSVVALGRGKGE